MSDAVLATPTAPIEAMARLAGRPRPSVGGALAVAGVAVVALAARLYELRDIPRLTDETDEVMRGLQIARGELLPLTNVDAYIGPLWNYLLAAGFVLVGPTPWWPLLLPLAFSLGTIAASVWLGRELAHRIGRADLAELLGGGTALLLASSSFHAIVSARIAWSHAMTPLFVTLALAALLRWERTQSAPALVGAGFAYGLAVHTHPTAVALVPGLLLWALLHWRGVLFARAGWLALALSGVAILPMLAFNLTSGFESARAAAQVQVAYSGGEATTSAGFVRNLGALLVSLPLLLAGEIGERRGAFGTADGPVAIVYAGLGLAGLTLACWRRTWLPLLVIGSVVLVLPIVNGKYEPLFNGRYLAPLLPLGFALVVLAVSCAAEAVASRAPASATPVWRGAAAGLLVVLAVPPLLALNGYIVTTREYGPNNRELYRAAEIVGAARPTRPVLVDATLSGTRQSTGREGTGVIEYVLILDARVPVCRLTPDELAEAAERGEAEIVVGSPRLLTRLDKSFDIAPPPGELDARRERRMNFVVFRVLGPA